MSKISYSQILLFAALYTPPAGSVTADSIRRLTALQLRVLRTLAMREGNGIYSGETLAAAQVYNSASMKRAVEKLIKDNLIYTFEGEYRFANPFFREWLKRN